MQAPIGADLRAARVAASLSIEQFAVYAGVGSATVERIEHGRGAPRRSTLLALAVALEETVNYRSHLEPSTSEAPAGSQGFAKERDDGAHESG